MLSFEKVLIAKARTVKSEEPFPETLVINAFRGFVDEFIKKRDNKELPDIKMKKESVKRKKKKENVVVSLSSSENKQFLLYVTHFRETSWNTRFMKDLISTSKLGKSIYWWCLKFVR